MNLSGVKQSLSNFWGERNKREQNLLVAAGTVVVLGILYVLLIDPALSGRGNLEKQLPALRQQAAEVRALAREAATLGTKTAAPAPPMTRENIESALGRHGLKAQSVTLSGELAKVQLNGASFSGIVRWLGEMHETARVSVVDANVEAQPQPNTVNATLSLRQQGNGQSQ